MTRRKVLLIGLTLCVLAFETLVLGVLVFFPYAPDPGLSAFHANVYAFLAPLSTIFLLGILYTWLVRLGIREARRRSGRFGSFAQFLSEPVRNLSVVKNRSLSDSTNMFKILSHPRLMLGISLTVSVLLAFIPYRPDLNPSGNLVGVDTPIYVGWVGQMLAMPLPQALQYSFVEGLDGSRPLLLVLLYLVSSGGASPSLVMELLPMVLAPLLSLSAYTFVRFGQGSARLAGLTALFTPVSFYITVGMWGAYYANWLGMIFGYLFLTSLLMFSSSPSSTKYGLMFALSIALFLTHPWTWVLITSVGLVFAVSLWRETGGLVHVKSIAGLVAAGVALDFVKSLAFATRTVAADLATKTPTIDILIGFWNELVEALLYSHGGLLGSWIVLGLALLGGVGLRFKDRFERLLILWVGVASLPFLILDSYHKARIVYDLPIPVLASVAMVLFLPVVGTRLVRWPGLWIVLILTLGTAYAVQGLLLL